MPGLIDRERIEMMRAWPHSGFSVHADRSIAPGNRRGLESFLEYMERPPVSLERLQYSDTGMVAYQGRYHPGLGRDHQLVTGVEFLAMLVPHIQVCASYYTSSDTWEHPCGSRAETPPGPSVAPPPGCS